MMLPLPFPASTISLDYWAVDGKFYTKANPHAGIDFSSRSRGVVAGTRIPASASGVVLRSGVGPAGVTPTFDRPNSLAGNSIDVLYPEYSVMVRYMHRPLKSPSPDEGQAVTAGDSLGLIGATGLVDAAHLHMETWSTVTRQRVSPYGYFDRTRYVGDGSPAGTSARPVPLPPAPVAPSPEEDDMPPLRIAYFRGVPGTTADTICVVNVAEHTFYRVASTVQADFIKQTAGTKVQDIAGIQSFDLIRGFREI